VALTMFGGPLSRKVPETRTFTVEGPAHSLLLEPFTRRVRAEVDGVTVLDTVRGALLFETGLPPQLYVPEEDLRTDLLEPSDTTTHCPFKGDATYRSLRVGERLIEDAVWLYERPIEAAAWLEGFACVYWEKADAWFVEDERVTHGLRDPYHRVDVVETSRPVRVTAGGELIAESERAKLLFETGVAPRVYIPGADVAAGALCPAAKRTVCPYKGEATYWDVRAVAEGAWSYESPLPESLAVRGHLSFEGEGIEVELAEPADRFALASV
jgi:uncharacterized protein (DUF427 family)